MATLYPPASTAVRGYFLPFNISYDGVRVCRCRSSSRSGMTGPPFIVNDERYRPDKIQARSMHMGFMGATCSPRTVGLTISQSLSLSHAADLSKLCCELNEGRASRSPLKRTPLMLKIMTKVPRNLGPQPVAKVYVRRNNRPNESSLDGVVATTHLVRPAVELVVADPMTSRGKAVIGDYL
ncbi:hypothetical protein Syun_001558 [Stephania yunnanensis]|uniref:Uncharacterized protein n=1 Tax=Stephania yunnanensis TaxID=152371 RepID=A0AAP0Q780_9MAGN